MTPTVAGTAVAADGFVATANVRADRYAFVIASHDCGACGALSPVVALYLPAGFLTFTVTDSHGEEAWEASAFDALLFDVAWVAAPVLARLQLAAPWWRPGLVASDAQSRWGNHCLACGANITDHELFAEPGSAFLFGDSLDRDASWIVPVEDALVGCAGGFALDPWSGGALPGWGAAGDRTPPAV